MFVSYYTGDTGFPGLPGKHDYYGPCVFVEWTRFL